jgi:lipid A ethanolaminephosphotransferase
MEVIKKYKGQLYFHLTLNLVFALFVTCASFVHIPLIGYSDHFLYFLQFILIQFSVFGFLYFLSINKLLFSIVFPILFIVFVTASFWVYVQDIAITKNIIQVSLETKSDIVTELITFPFILFQFFALLFALLIIYFHTKIKINQLTSPLIYFAIVGVLMYPSFEFVKMGIFNRRLPFNLVESTKEYFDQNQLLFKPIPTTLKATNDSLSIVFILGESVRADHLQLNGYPRNTNPFLSKRKNLISFPNTYTPNTCTALSVPQILTDASLFDDYSAPKYSLIEILNHANIETNWIGNQTPENSYEIFIQQSKFNTIIDPLHSELSFQKDFDQQLLPVFKKVFNPTKNQFTTLHMMGSHWWYETRYPESFRKYKPVIESKHIPSNSKQEMINSYDNTILYLDYFINETIKQIEKENTNTLLIYLSDHGESLGENGFWLHAQSGKELMNPALLIWYSDKFKEKHPTEIFQLQANSTKKIALDFFFQSILDLYKIKGINYKKDNLIYQ